ncbi:MAG: LuxR family transcriptional regulator [Rhodoferax sp.]|nr:LuxR family transcriptional regulator [Rhodoferax sp.]
MIARLGQARFASAVLEELQPFVPAASWSVYRTGAGCSPQLFLSASRGVPDTTRDCWHAYLSGPQQRDQTLMTEQRASSALMLCHVAAEELPVEHRVLVYQAHGMAERLSVVRQEEGGALFAVNFYRHLYQQPFEERQIAAFEALAPTLQALAHKHVEIAAPAQGEGLVGQWRRKLALLEGRLTARELDVCARLLHGMTQEGIAADLGLSVPTVKTYRNRAFARLGISFRNELFAALARHPLLH